MSDIDIIHLVGTETTWLPLDSLLVNDSPRLGGADDDHVRTLAGIDAKLPPIIVHSASMRIIDGVHRHGAALLRGDATIEAVLFDGSEHEAFLLSVSANIRHGLPLSPRDRLAAAARVIGSHPHWSDRVIADATGLGARTVSGLRRRLGDTGASERIGRDGRVRPLDNTVGRLKAAEIIRSRPDASLRVIAKHAGVSPTTARDVRARLSRGEDPVRPTRRRPPAGPEPSNITAILRGLKNDPSLRLTDAGRSLLRWVTTRAIQPEERHLVVDKVPAHSTYTVAALARRCADEWLRLADELETRTRGVPDPVSLGRAVQLPPAASLDTEPPHKAELRC